MVAPLCCPLSTATRRATRRVRSALATHHHKGAPPPSSMGAVAHPSQGARTTAPTASRRGARRKRKVARDLSTRHRDAAGAPPVQASWPRLQLTLLVVEPPDRPAPASPALRTRDPYARVHHEAIAPSTAHPALASRTSANVGSAIRVPSTTPCAPASTSTDWVATATPSAIPSCRVRPTSEPARPWRFPRSARHQHAIVGGDEDAAPMPTTASAAPSMLTSWTFTA